MHRSQLAGFIIDCQTDDLDQAANFWSRALGYPAARSGNTEDAHYVGLITASNDLCIEVQSVDHPSRVHLDIEADDVEAEVTRLERLGARRIKQIRAWWVMEAPTGHRFCVIRPQHADFASESNCWE